MPARRSICHIIAWLEQMTGLPSFCSRLSTRSSDLSAPTGQGFDGDAVGVVGPGEMHADAARAGPEHVLLDGLLGRKRDESQLGARVHAIVENVISLRHGF